MTEPRRETRRYRRHYEALAKSVPTLDAVHEMARAIEALRLELPESVHEDVLARWERVLGYVGQSGRHSVGGEP